MYRRGGNTKGGREAKESRDYCSIAMERSHGEATIGRVQRFAKTIEKAEEIEQKEKEIDEKVIKSVLKKK